MPEIKSVLCCSRSTTPCHLHLFCKNLSIFTHKYRDVIQTKVRLKCKFTSFCEAALVATSNERWHCLKKILCFSSYGSYCQKAVNNFLWNIKDVQWEASGSIYPDRMFFSFSFSSLFSIVAHRKKLCMTFSSSTDCKHGLQWQNLSHFLCVHLSTRLHSTYLFYIYYIYKYI